VIGRWRASRKRLSGAQKEKPGGGNAGSDLFVIGVYGFKYAAWLLLVAPESAERLLLLSSQRSVLVLLLSCSSLTFRNLTEPFATSHRFLFVCALTRPWVGTTLRSKTHAQSPKTQLKQWSETSRGATDWLSRSVTVKRSDSAVTETCSRVESVLRRKRLFHMPAQIFSCSSARRRRRGASRKGA
jgi:hypothetical protein